ncbi:MAG: hypothetical protein UR23_C0031G0003 [Candidatus Roizmanbacteria bacterium GW2011_GWA2_32_13]|uniref:Uncharacterized protein n=1 Tax=Candidatus Roizmanbacteria bacterium GW2011_GWA2_32_13 TaxID=1618475 RepID=A0A0F9YUZ6_9BACT|nr:MAG: hypothetical protein UR23_C0031G0003 [Candidatus Roizmanbacteria bacterium GW2011_GWA2_32_13]
MFLQKNTLIPMYLSEQIGIETLADPRSLQGQMETIIKCLHLKDNSNPRIYKKGDYERLVGKRYETLEGGEVFSEGLFAATIVNVRNKIRESFPEQGILIEVGAGSGIFTQHAIYPEVKEKGGTVIATEIGQGDETFSEITEPKLKASTKSGISADNLGFAKDKTINMVAGIGVFDVLSVSELEKTAKEIKRVLVNGGQVMIGLDLGPDLGWARLPHQLPTDFFKQDAVKKEYEAGLINRGINLHRDINLSSKGAQEAIRLARMFNKIKKLNLPDQEIKKFASTILGVTYLFEEMVLFTEKSMTAKGFPGKLPNSKDFSNLIFSLFDNKQDLILIDQIFKGSQQNENKGGGVFNMKITIRDLLVSFYEAYVMYMLKKKNEKKPDAEELDINEDAFLFIFQQITHFFSGYAIESAFKKIGFETKQEYITSPFLPVVTDIKGTMHNCAGLRITEESEDSKVSSGMVWITATKI